MSRKSVKSKKSKNGPPATKSVSSGKDHDSDDKPNNENEAVTETSTVAATTSQDTLGFVSGENKGTTAEDDEQAEENKNGEVQIADDEDEWNEVVGRKGRTEQPSLPAGESSATQEEERTTQLTANQKRKNKKKQKKQNKLKREAGKEFIQRHVSPEFKKVQKVSDITEFAFENLNMIGRKNREYITHDHDTSSDSDEASESDEEFEDYIVEGYHPCHVNEIIDAKYICLKKLGWGHFSTVWLALKLQDKQLYALKIQKSAPRYTESALEEEEILYDVASNFRSLVWEKSVQGYMKNSKLEITRQHTHNLQMFDQFFHHSNHGKHSVMAFEVLGKNLLSMIKKYDYEGIPIPIVREITRQTLMGLDYLHRVCNIIHTDLKPENVVFGLSERQKFDMLYTNVLQTPLVDLYDQNEPIILNKKQQKNQKKKERKKQKAKQEQLLKKSTGADDEEDESKEEKKEGADPNDNLTQEEQELKDLKESRTDAIIKTIRQKLTREEEEFQASHVFRLKYRSQSHAPFTSSYTKRTLIQEQENQPSGYLIYDHPLRSYTKFVKNHVLDGFAKLKEQSKGDDKQFKKLLQKVRPKRFMRVKSAQDLHSQVKASEELKPKGKNALRRVLDIDFNIKLCDMGNACYIDKHYSDVIQTREYRSPEVILDGEYDETADIWSLACMVFELVTGDYLFDPKKGKTFKKNDDHLALITELIGEPRDQKWLKSHDGFEDFYQKKSFKLKRIKEFKYWSVYHILAEKYLLKDMEAHFLANFLERALKWNPKDRASAKDLLDDPWMKMSPDYDSHVSRGYLKEWKQVNRAKDEQSSSSSSKDEKDNDKEGDDEDDDDDSDYSREEEEDEEDSDEQLDDDSDHENDQSDVPESSEKQIQNE